MGSPFAPATVGIADDLLARISCVAGRGPATRRVQHGTNAMLGRTPREITRQMSSPDGSDCDADPRASIGQARSRRWSVLARTAVTGPVRLTVQRAGQRDGTGRHAMDRYLNVGPVNSAIARRRLGDAWPERTGDEHDARQEQDGRRSALGARMNKRLASCITIILGVVVAPLTLVGLTASSGSAATAATPTYFGAKLTSQSQPSNAEDGQRCDEQGGIRHGATCTWVAISAFETGSHYTAPRTGTIKHVQLVSCIAGKFRLFLASANPSTSEAKLIYRGPEISYAGQSPCGGTSGQHYILQRFKVALHVTNANYIAINAMSTGTLSCSGGDGFLLYAPVLHVGQPLKKSHSGDSCDLL